jgi:hypothetical protein
MDKSGFLVAFFVLGYLAFEIYGVHSSRHLMQPGYIYDKYTAAQHAVERCGLPEGANQAQFANNIAVMRRKARAELAQADPAAAAGAIDAELERRAAAKRAEVDALIEEQGCKGKALWTLAKNYEQNARLRLQ